MWLMCAYARNHKINGGDKRVVNEAPKMTEAEKVGEAGGQSGREGGGGDAGGREDGGGGPQQKEILRMRGHSLHISLISQGSHAINRKCLKCL